MVSSVSTAILKVESGYRCVDDQHLMVSSVSTETREISNRRGETMINTLWYQVSVQGKTEKLFCV